MNALLALTPNDTAVNPFGSITIASENADNPFAVAIGVAGGRKEGQTSYVLCHQPKSFDWRRRGGAPHPMKRLSDARFAEVLALLNQVIQLT